MSEGRSGPSLPGGDDWSEEEAQLLRGLFLDEAQQHVRRSREGLAELIRAVEGGTVVSEPVNALLRALHSLKGSAGSVGYEAIGRAAHELEEICAEIRSGTLAPTPGMLERLEEGLSTLQALIEGAAVTRPRTHSRPAPVAAFFEPPGERRRAADRRGLDRRPDRSVRVDAARLDALQGGVGDLVVLRTRIERRLRELEGVHVDLNSARAALRGVPALLGDPGGDGAAALDRLAEVEVEFTAAAAHLDRATRALGAEAEGLRRTTAELDEELRRARLVPLEWAFSRLPLAARELERAAGRPVELITRGGEIEVDKNVVDQLVEPLLHLLRNAVAHGVEPPGERQARGKSVKGRIQVSARQEGEFVFVRFEDDGRGLDRAEIRQALVRQGRIEPNTTVSEELLRAVLFEPGFSTRQSADALAGRGMGLNIVKRALLRLGGDVQVEDQAGAGTFFRLSVPLQAAITQALLFKVGGQVYAVPAAHVAQALPLGSDALLVKDGGRESVLVRQRTGSGALPILRLQTLLGGELAPGRRPIALHINYGDRGFVVTCDKVIGPRTIAVRPLGPLLTDLPLYAGVTVSGAGKAQLVLDLGALAEAAYAPVRTPHVAARRSSPRVLVVDDSRLAREAAARALLGAGLQAVTAEDGWEAWELLGERRFDLLITDLEMPRVDGFELIARVRQEPTLRHLPVIVLSSRTGPGTRARATRAGANLVLAKGLSKKALADAVLAVMETHKDAHTPSELPDARRLK